MPVLTDYAQQPVIDNTRWAPSNAKWRFSSASYFKSAATKGGLLLQSQTRQKRSKIKSEKDNQSSSPSEGIKPTLNVQPSLLQCSEPEAKPPVFAVRGILVKPLAPKQLSDPITLVNEGSSDAGVTCVQSPTSSTSSHAATKKVRFSKTLRPEHAELHPQLSPPCCEHDILDPHHNCSESPIESDLAIHLQPVIETIFFTHSPYAYDRSPITVDKAFNKSLDLPPRAQHETHRRDECYYPRPTAILYNEAGYDCCSDDLAEQQFSSSLGANFDYVIPSPPMNSRRFTSAHFEIEGNSPEKLLWPGVSLLSNPSYAELEFSNSDPSRVQSKRCRSTDLNEWTSSQTDSESTSFHSDDFIQKAEADKRAIESSSHEEEELCGFGNWTRAQVFGSHDVLDGF